MQSFKQYITELFDKPARWKLAISEPDRLTYQANVGGNTLSVDFVERGLYDWEMNFDVNGKQNVTGDGNEIIIFSTVLDIMKDFDERVDDVRFITFDAAKGGNLGDSRVKLYDRLVKKFASLYDYTLVDKSDRELGVNIVTKYVLEKD